MPKIIKSKKEKTKKNKPQKPIVTYMLSALKGLVVSLACLLLIIFLFINNGSFTVFTKVIIYVVIGFGAMLSGFIAYKKFRGRGIINGLLASVFYLFIFIIITVIVMRFQIGVNLLLIVPIILLSGIIGGIISANT